jgi:head-tail adaptor
MLPKKHGTGIRYLPASAFNCYITFLSSADGGDGGAAADGTPNASAVVSDKSKAVHANLAPWRGRELDKGQLRTGQSSYKLTIRYPKTYSVDTSMLIQMNVGTTTHLFNIDSIMDPDGQGVELHMWVFEDNPKT